jgi:hypothetical protein
MWLYDDLEDFFSFERFFPFQNLNVEGIHVDQFSEIILRVLILNQQEAPSTSM